MSPGTVTEPVRWRKVPWSLSTVSSDTPNACCIALAGPRSTMVRRGRLTSTTVRPASCTYRSIFRASSALAPTSSPSASRVSARDAPLAVGLL